MKIFVKAKAGVKREGIKKIDGAHYIVSVKTPAKNGKANRAIEGALADYFDLPVSGMRIVKGHAGRNKIVEIT